MPGWLNGHRPSALVTLLGGLAAAILLLAAAGTFDAPPDTVGDPLSPPPTSGRPQPSPVAGAPGGRTPAASTPAASPPVQPTDSPATPPAGEVLPLVPVVGFWADDTDISLAELERALQGRSRLYQRVIVPAQDRAAIETALGVPLGAEVESGDVGAVARAVRRGALGLLRVTQVTPDVRALSLNGHSLFGNDRLRDHTAWPLSVLAGDGQGWQQEASWTIVAGGDIQLDRWMAYHVWRLDKGVDWPWDGGTVRITRRVCCSNLGHRVPEWQATGNEGAVRGLFSRADLAMANLEAAAVNDPEFHRLPADFRLSLSFSGDPRLLDGLEKAGFDFLSLANNHIHNAGDQGIADTRQNLRNRGIAFAGAGRHLEQATRPAVLEAAGQRIVMLPCMTVGRVARADRGGSAPCTGNLLVRQIRDVADDADVVIVFPHWGAEYRSQPSASQRRLAQRWVEAGADLVLGAHSHWVGSIEEIDESLVFYSLGNLAFDQPWSEPTMQGVIIELTFNADRLAQVRLHPTLIVDDVQPNLLELDGGGQRVLRRVREASEGLLPY